jgi:hypothetical protein
VDIIGRDQWGARYTAGDGPAPLPAREVWLHHSVTAAPAADAPEDADVAAVRELERIGEDRFGAGISYTHVIAPSGRVFEGHPIDRRGTHTGGRNSTSRGICWLGNYQDTEPTEAMVAATVALLQHGHAAGWWQRQTLAGGHRDVKATACPGTRAYRLIPDINRRAAGDAMPDQTAPATSHGPAEFVRALMNAPVDDLYREGLPRLSFHAAVAWGTAHAAHARDAADTAAKVATRVESKLAEIRLDLLDERPAAAALDTSPALQRIEQKLDALLAGGHAPEVLAQQVIERAAQLLTERLAAPPAA